MLKTEPTDTSHHLEGSRTTAGMRNPHVSPARNRNPSSMNSPASTRGSSRNNRCNLTKRVSGSQGSSPASPGPGRTPQTRRKELALQSSRSPSGSPRVAPKSGTKSSVAAAPAPANGVGSKRPRKAEVKKTTRNAKRPSLVAHNKVPSIVTSSYGDTSDSNKESFDLQEKFKKLWQVKTIEHGMVRVPIHFLQDLIHKQRIESIYDLQEKPVASGLFATVRKCTHRETGIEYAAKFSSRLRCGVDCSPEILHEIAMLSVCNDSNKIVHLKEVFQNQHEIILVLEYAPGGDFQSVLDDDMVPFEEDVQGFLKQILEALSFIHEKNIAHLDIKPQNIVLMGQFPNCEIKLCDLEVARLIDSEENIREIIGTPDYVAPEILSLDPITLAADIWSLGVLAYVLLTGFSPFGGDSDQETLRNISVAKLDFPQELFEGVSDMAKDFIRGCLNRDPKERPTIQECLKHPWLVEEEEPPSPSPLMLKIPAADPFAESKVHAHRLRPHQQHVVNAPSAAAVSPSSSSLSRRSCQTCRDKVTERKRYLSKSREAIFEKVANSNLKKSLSKSRERLCDVRLTISKSREFLNGGNMKSLSRSQNKLPSFKSLSKSQEVLSTSLGGAMKRMVNGAVSDISHALPFSTSDTENSMNLLLMPENALVLSQSEMLKLNFDSLQLLPISESDIIEAQDVNKSKKESHSEDPTNKEEIDAGDNSERKESDSKESGATDTEKETHEVEKKKEKVTFSIGVQVNMMDEDKENEVESSSQDLLSDKKCIETLPEGTDESLKTSKSFSHESTLGKANRNSFSWQNELAKLPVHRRVSDLIDTFSKHQPSSTEEDSKQQRRISLQLTTDKLERTSREDTEQEKKEKLARRKSASAILTSPVNEMNILNLTNLIMDATSKNESEVEDAKAEAVAAPTTSTTTTTLSTPVTTSSTSTAASSTTNQKPATPATWVPTPPPAVASPVLRSKRESQKNWDYFEIDHPKAISEKKLLQLKAKYQRRKTDSSLTQKPQTITEEKVDEVRTVKDYRENPPVRTKSLPYVEITKIMSESKPLQLSIDPLTGACLDDKKYSSNGCDINSNNPPPILAEGKQHKEMPKSHQISPKEKHDNNTIPDNHIFEVHIDPLTGEVETIQVPLSKSKKSSKLSVDVKQDPSHTKNEDDGFGSLPHTPTEVSLDGSLNNQLKPTEGQFDDVGIFTSSEEVLESITDSSRPSLDRSQSESLDDRTRSSRRSAEVETNRNSLVMLESDRSRSLSEQCKRNSNESPDNSNPEKESHSMGSRSNSFAKALEKFKNIIE